MVVLASASPRRRELLGRLLDTFDVRPSDIPEVLGAGPLEAAVAALALAKARAVAASVPGAVVLGADTIVCIGTEVFGKPADAGEAREMLRRLRGRWHEVITGVAAVAGDREATVSVVSRVLMAGVDDAAIDAYVATGEPLDKAGAYAIQGAGGSLVAGLVGSYTNVIGLPLAETAALLASFGVL
ncbi:MAG: septum formation protein Maf [Candidatus Rokubacteria bacterium]|nr:septum formation protein Maf [Candidatus Rokubacteria bacterium]